MREAERAGEGRLSHDGAPLAGFELVDLPGAVRALQAMLDRPLTLRPVRRLEVLGWDGRPIRETDAWSAFVEAGFSADGSRLSWDGYPGPRLPVRPALRHVVRA